MIHGFAYSNYLNQLAVPSTIGVVGADLNLAFNGAFNHTRDFLMDAFTLMEDEAIGLMSVGCDFIVTQVRNEVIFPQPRCQSRSWVASLDETNARLFVCTVAGRG